MRPLLLALLLFLLLCLAPHAASADPPRAPPFGSNRWRTELGPWEGDEDDYVAPLLRGERLRVAASPARGAALRLRVLVVDPTGAVRADVVADAVAGVVARAGRGVSANVTADATGPWTVRVRDAAGATGAYVVRFAVRAAPRAPPVRGRLGGDDPPERAHEVDGIDGALLTTEVTVARGSAAAGVSAVEGPSGGAVPLPRATRRGRAERLAGVELEDGAGAYRVVVGLDEGRAAYVLRTRVAPPPRPRGADTLPLLEPKLARRAEPLRGNASQVVRLAGANLSAAPPAEVWFGDRRATVVHATANGTSLDVVPPPHPEGALVAVTVRNPDAQVAFEEGYFVYAVPEPPRLRELVPGTASVYARGTLRYRLSLTKAAPAGGVTVALSAPGGVGALPPSVTVAAGATDAQFELVAGAAAGTGRVEALHAERVLAGDVTVVPSPDGDPGDAPPLPDELDVSGWSLVQASSARTYVFPAGTKLRQGDVVLVGRAATRAAFETYWGVSLGSHVRYFTNDPANTSSAGDDWPSINGDETFEVRDALGLTVDGPSAALPAGGLVNLQRLQGAPAAAAASWTSSFSIGPGGAPTPGAVPAPDGTKRRVWISEIADAPPGTGQFAFEYVELAYDGNP